MILIMAVILAVAWLLGFVVFHVASLGIHLLLAIVGVVVHLARGTAVNRKPAGRLG
jgi:hypothetical protein